MWQGDTQSQGSSFPTPWALNPSAYVNVANEQVDWATLAQQWIKMKEGLPPTEKEEGEAPMEITKETSPTRSESSNPNWSKGNQPMDGVWPANWVWEQSSGWCWSGTGEAKAPPSFIPNSYTSAPDTSPSTVASSAPIPSFPYTSQPSSSSQGFSGSQVNLRLSSPEPSLRSSCPQNYWANDHKEGGWEGSSRPHRKSGSVASTPEPLPELDSARRKQLPAWIREGLEKMEREKQKKAENERMERQRLEAAERLKEEEERRLRFAEMNGSPMIPKKSKFETDSEESGEEREVPPEKQEKGRKSRFEWKSAEQASSSLKPTFRTKEDILQHVMGKVRKVLTQLLMEVTTEETKAIVAEVYDMRKKKAPATTVRKTQALTSLTGKLGLGIYDSESGSDASDNEANGVDSDQELTERIRRRKEDFIDTERRIEREIVEQEEKERRVLLGKRSVSREGSIEPEEQVQLMTQGGGSESKGDRKSSRDSPDYKVDGRELKTENSSSHSTTDREKLEGKKESEKHSKKSDRRGRRHSTESSDSRSSRSSSSYRKRKHRHGRRGRRSRSRSRSRSQSRTRSRDSRSHSRSRSRDRKYRRKDKRYRSRSGSSRRRRSPDRRRNRSSSTSSSDYSHKRSNRR